jgi:hypothetical protein
MIWFAVLAACGSPCVDTMASCEPLYEPTFDNVFDNTLRPTCGSEGTACHGAEGAQGGVVFEEIEASYAVLTEASEGEPIALPSDASCSLLMQLITSADEAFAMPPGDPLSAEERCAIQMWIDQGASR